MKRNERKRNHVHNQMVLNHKIWQWYERNEDRARLYDELWQKAAYYAEANLTGEDLDYYFRTTD